MKNSLSYTKVGTAGFSLVELMVVVAIIGILATVAIPNFTKFQAKAKQSSAKSELTGMFTAQKAFFAEYSTYHTNWPYIGYAPDGHPMVGGCPQAATTTRHYVTGFSETGPVAEAQPNFAPTGAPAIPAACDALAEARTLNFPATVAGAGPLDPAYTVSAANIFVAQARGIIGSGGAAAQDSWFIDQNKMLRNNQSGL